MTTVYITVMEVISGEHGDVVPKLAHNVLSGACEAFNNRYKPCLPKRLSVSSKTLAEKKRISGADMSLSSAGANSHLVDGSVRSVSTGDDTMDSSKDSSEEVGFNISQNDQ